MPRWRYDEEGDVVADSCSNSSSEHAEPADDSDESAEIRRGKLWENAAKQVVIFSLHESSTPVWEVVQASAFEWHTAEGNPLWTTIRKDCGLLT